MTGDRWFRRGPLRSGLGRRLLAAFVAVALSSVVVLTIAALVGTSQGLTSARQSDRHEAAVRTAEAGAAAYEQAGGWSGARLDTASAIAGAAGARLIVQDTDGRMMWPGRGPRTRLRRHAHRYRRYRRGCGRGARRGRRTDRGHSPADLYHHRHRGPGGRLLGAAVVALAAALLVSGYVARRLTRPLLALTAAARRFAAGDRAARTRTGGPGELGELARAFDTMADEVARAEQVRRNLAADVAHELRTPLAALQAGLEELRDGLRAPDTARLVTLHDQSLRLGRVVEDLAELSAAESAALSLHLGDADLTGITRAALAAYRPRLDSAGLHVDADLATPLPVHGDTDRLHQAVTNLLANATRCCRPGDRLTIHPCPPAHDRCLRMCPPPDLHRAASRWRRRGAARRPSGEDLGHGWGSSGCYGSRPDWRRPGSRPVSRTTAPTPPARLG